MKDIWGAISDETRRKILILLKSRPHTAGEISDQFTLAPSTVSHHLKVLEEGDLICSNRRAQTIVYSLNEARFKELKDDVRTLIDL